MVVRKMEILTAVNNQAIIIQLHLETSDKKIKQSAYNQSPCAQTRERIREGEDLKPVKAVTLQVINSKRLGPDKR